MSAYWYFECLDHTPALQSADEFTQHTDDGAYRAGVELAQQRPVDADDYSTGTGHFEGNARSFLVQHPTCSLGLVSEYGERRALPDSQTPSIADMAPGTTFTAEFKETGRRVLFVRVGGDTAWPNLAVEFGSLATYTDYAVDPSTIRDVTPPKEQS